jgi:hypothetical protein
MAEEWARQKERIKHWAIESSVGFQWTTRPYIKEDRTLHSHSCNNANPISPTCLWIFTRLAKYYDVIRLKRWNFFLGKIAGYIVNWRIVIGAPIIAVSFIRLILQRLALISDHVVRDIFTTNYGIFRWYVYYPIKWCSHPLLNYSNYSADQKALFFENQISLHRVHRSSQLGPIFRYTSPTVTIITCFFRRIFVISSHLRVVSNAICSLQVPPIPSSSIWFGY